jgi:hypothetical protein
MRPRVTENCFDRQDGIAVLDDVAELESRLIRESIATGLRRWGWKLIRRAEPSFSQEHRANTF